VRACAPTFPPLHSERDRRRRFLQGQEVGADGRDRSGELDADKVAVRGGREDRAAGGIGKPASAPVEGVGACGGRRRSKCARHAGDE
jgi:hypothetical protein